MKTRKKQRAIRRLLFNMEIHIRKANSPEVIFDESMDLEKILSSYEGKVIGLVEAHNLKCETRAGRFYHEGKLFIHRTIDDKGKPVKSYYVQRDDGCHVPIDLGDGLFLRSLPTKPYLWSPENN